MIFCINVTHAVKLLTATLLNVTVDL